MYQLIDETLENILKYDFKYSALVYSAFAKKKMNNKDEFTIDSLKILGLNPLFL